jgi:hypothetical protein
MIDTSPILSDVYYRIFNRCPVCGGLNWGYPTSTSDYYCKCYETSTDDKGNIIQSTGTPVFGVHDKKPMAEEVSNARTNH